LGCGWGVLGGCGGGVLVVLVCGFVGGCVGVGVCGLWDTTPNPQTAPPYPSPPLAGRALERGAARGTGGREDERDCIGRTLLQHRRHHLGESTSPARRNNLPCRPHALLAVQLVLVMQRRERDRRAPTKTGSSTANGVTLPVRPVLTRDALDARRALLGREFVRDSPSAARGWSCRARRAAPARRPSPRAVDLVRKILAAAVAKRSQQPNASGNVATIEISSLNGTPAAAQIVERLAWRARRRPAPRQRYALDQSRCRRTRRERARRGRARVLSGAGCRRRALRGWRTAAVRRSPSSRLMRSNRLVRQVDLASGSRARGRVAKSPTRRIGRERIRCAVLGVMSSPTAPSPRVAPRVKDPFSYVSETASPSIFG